MSYPKNVCKINKFTENKLNKRFKKINVNNIFDDEHHQNICNMLYQNDLVGYQTYNYGGNPDDSDYERYFDKRYIGVLNINGGTNSGDDGR